MASSTNTVTLSGAGDAETLTVPGGVGKSCRCLVKIWGTWGSTPASVTLTQDGVTVTDWSAISNTDTVQESVLKCGPLLATDSAGHATTSLTVEALPVMQ